MKYALLHCSYSAPICVLDITSETVSIAARDTTGDAVRAVVVPDADLRSAVAVRDTVAALRVDAGRWTAERVIVLVPGIREVTVDGVRAVALRPATARVDAVRDDTV